MSLNLIVGEVGLQDRLRVALEDVRFRFSLAGMEDRIKWHPITGDRPITYPHVDKSYSV